MGPGEADILGDHVSMQRKVSEFTQKLRTQNAEEKRSHKQRTTQFEGQIREIKHGIAAEQTRMKDLQHASEDARKTEESVKAEIEEMRSKENQLPQDIHSSATELSRRKQKLASLQKTVKSKQQKEKEQRDALVTGIQFYEDRLGLKFQRVGNSRLRFIFTYVNPAFPARKFSFAVKINDDGKYQLEECKPSLPGNTASKLVDTVNETNDFAGFVLGFRRAFKNKCT